MILRINGTKHRAISCKTTITIISAAKIAVLAAFLSCLILFVLLPPTALSAAEVDYQELQEDPLETAFRKLKSTGSIEWDEEEMLEGPPPAIIKDMVWPLKSCILGGTFNNRRRTHRHTGVDLLADKGTPIFSVLDGIVEVVSNGGNGFRGYGKVIIINHSNKLWTLYSHCSTMSVRVGQRVKRGDVIATVGRTGRASANHLHFEVRNSRGTPLNPMKYLPYNPFVKNRR